MEVEWPMLLSRGAWQRLPSHVYRALVVQLFSISVSVTLTEALLIALVGGLAAWQAQDVALAAMTGGTAMLVLLLLPAAARARRHIASGAEGEALRAAERRFELLVWAASAGIGVMAARAIFAYDDPLLHLTLVALTLGSAITSLRDHYRPVLALGKTAALLGPPSAAALLTGDTYYQLLGIGGLLAAKLVVDLCLQLYRSSLALQLALGDKDTLAGELRQKAEQLALLQGRLIQNSRLSAMGAMGSALAHELNQPLTSVANYARGSRRLLAENPSPEQIALAAEGLQAAEAGALRAGEIVRRIRSMVTGDSVVRRPHDLSQIVRESCEFACEDAEHEIECQVNIPPGQIFVSVDAVQIQQVLINIVRNALDAAAQAERPCVTINARVTDREAELSVADNGPGLPDPGDEDIFTPFHSTRREGMGLGLPISRAIVESHGGRIWSVPRGRSGAEFRFTLPLEELLCPALTPQQAANGS